MRKIEQSSQVVKNDVKGGAGGMCPPTCLGRAKGWFLTWPRCDISKDDALTILADKFNIQEYVICEEEHQDGGKHLHAFIKLEKAKRIKSNSFDLKSFHGHYEKAKCWRAVQEYCKKDGNYISNINIENAKQKQSKKLEKEDYERDALELIEEGKLHIMSLNNFIRNQNTYLLLKKRKNDDRRDNSPVKKKRHEWIYGESNTGKSTLLREEMKDNEENWFQIPYNNDWSGYINQEHLWADEYKGQLKINELNRICDGGAKMNTKGGTIILAKDVIVHIVSNYSIKDCYSESKDNILNTLLNRFIENKLTHIYN